MIFILLVAVLITGDYVKTHIFSSSLDIIEDAIRTARKDDIVSLRGTIYFVNRPAKDGRITLKDLADGKEYPSTVDQLVRSSTQVIYQEDPEYQNFVPQ